MYVCSSVYVLDCVMDLSVSFHASLTKACESSNGTWRKAFTQHFHSTMQCLSQDRVPSLENLQGPLPWNSIRQGEQSISCSGTEHEENEDWSKYHRPKYTSIQIY